MNLNKTANSIMDKELNKKMSIFFEVLLTVCIVFAVLYGLFTLYMLVTNGSYSILKTVTLLIAISINAYVLVSLKRMSNGNQVTEKKPTFSLESE
jgi:predicted membrane protein